MPSCFVSCGPNEVLVVSGCCIDKPVLIPGGRIFVWPIFQKVYSIPLNVMTLHVESPVVYTSQGVPISVTGIAQIKIQGQNEEMLRIACEMFLGKNEVEIANIALVTLEGHQRAIMGAMTVEEIYQDRKKFSTNVFEVASSDLVNMGITVVSYTLKDVRDDEGYLMSLGMKRTAQVKRDARIGEAEAKRDSTIKEAQAEMERMASRLQNDTEIAKAKRDYELKKAQYEVESLTKKAEAEMAFELQAAKIKQRLVEEKMRVQIIQRSQEIILEEQEIQRKSQELEATVKVPADAEKFRLETIADANRNRLIMEAQGDSEAIRLKGEAEAFAIKTKAKAEADQMGQKAKALSQYSEAAVIDMVMEALPRIAEEIATPLSRTKKITMVSNGSGSVGPAKLTEEIFSIVSKVPEAVKSLTGLDLALDVESSRSYMDDLYSSDMDKCLQAIICLKNSVIGSNRQKGSVIALGVVPRLIQLLSDPNIPNQIKIHATVTLNSLAKGTDEHIKALIDLGVVPHLLNGLVSNESKLVEYCLCCLRSIFKSPHAPVDLLYYDENLTSHLLSLALLSVSNQVCVTTVLATACKTAERQALLCSQGAVGTLAALLCSPHYKVQMPTLCCLANITFQNPVVSSVVATTSYGGKSIPELVVTLTERSRPTDVQLAAAKVLANLQRAGAIPANDSKILYRALPCLVQLCKEDNPPQQRVEAAETLAFLTEVDMELQRLASISNNLIPTLAALLRGMPLATDHKLSQDMKQAAFRAFASLGANDEDIRKRIIDIDNLMQHVVAGLEEPSPGVQLAAVRCLHSLSRSVQQLRTTFQDHRVWQPLMHLLKGDDDILTVASSTLCNLLLEFSPSKEPILESGAIDLLCDLTRRPDPALRLNGIWALMNMAFQAEQKIKSQILSSLGTDQIFRLLSDSEVSVLMKTLGLLRNLLSTKPHIDHIMSLHAIQIMQAVILILEGGHSAEVKEQALCILANIADGDSAKDYIMANEDVLKKLTDYMMHSNVKLQIAAVYCISNLVWREDAGASERQIRLKEMGVYKLLQQLIMTSDTALFDKVKTAMTQFSEA